MELFYFKINELPILWHQFDEFMVISDFKDIFASSSFVNKARFLVFIRPYI